MTKTLPATGQRHFLSLATLAVQHGAGPTDLLVIRHPGQKAPRLVYRRGDPDFSFEVAAAEIVIVETT